MEFNNLIYINQLGYLPKQDKYFITSQESKGFTIVSKNDEEVYRGTVSLRSELDESTGTKLYIGYFSDVIIEGEFHIHLDSGNQSYPLFIKQNIYNNAASVALKSFTFQRCGSELKESDFGEFKRDCCHNKLTKYHPSTGLKGSKDVTGGWHDAGDYGRYITPGAVTLACMMIGYEQFPEQYSCIPGFIEEITYELDWMLKMQELDINNDKYGALHFMVNGKDYGWDVPDKDDEELFITGYCSVATSDFAAISALASRIFKETNPEYSKTLLERSIMAWNFIEKVGEYPIGGFVRPQDMITGGYADDPKNNLFKDFDKLWPATELYLTTKDAKYKTVIDKYITDDSKFSGQLNWMNKSGFSEIQYLMATNNELVRNRFLERCNNHIAVSKKDGFLTTFKEYEYHWGSNGDMLNRSLELILAYKLTGDKKYYNCVLSQTNYLLGVNIHSMSFIAGIGNKFPKNIHHASFDNDGIDICFPGIMAGGANRDVECDSALKSVYSKGTPGAKCYIDHMDSYSSNENCITYSASLIPVFSFLSKK